MDMNDFAARMKQMEEDRAAEVKATRNTLIKELRGEAITKVIGEYDGWGDSGNVNDIQLQPEGEKLSDDLQRRLTDFIWDVAYNEHPGFEINDGGEGTLEWDLNKDAITLEHGMHYTQTDWTTSEDL